MERLFRECRFGNAVVEVKPEEELADVNHTSRSRALL